MGQTNSCFYVADEGKKRQSHWLGNRFLEWKKDQDSRPPALEVHVGRLLVCNQPSCASAGAGLRQVHQQDLPPADLPPDPSLQVEQAERAPEEVPGLVSVPPPPGCCVGSDSSVLRFCSLLELEHCPRVLCLLTLVFGLSGC